MTTASAATDAASQRDLTSAEKKQTALRWARDYIAENGKRGAGAAVSRQFGMSPRWGQDVASEAEESATSARGSADRHRIGTADRQSIGTADRQSTGTVADAAARAGMPGPARVAFGTPGSAPASTSTPGSAGESAPRPAQPATPPVGSGTRSAEAASSTSTADRQGIGTQAGTNRQGGLSAWLSAAVASGQLVAWLGFAFGAAVSVAANVKHAYIPRPPEGLEEAAAKAWTPPPEWAPDMSAVLGAAVWPLMLLLAVEVMTRVSWGGGWWNLARFGGVGIVGLGSAIISYGHIRDVLMTWHYGSVGAHIGPIVVDGLMVVSGFALLSISQAADRGGKS